MTPEELDKRITALEKVQNNQMYSLFINRLIQNVDPVVDANLYLNIALSGNAEAIDVLDFPDKFLRVQYNGKTYLVPAYLIDR